MPGIYLQDPGATSSLGNILGGLAENLSPQGQARAQLIYQQTEGADLANKLKSMTLQGALGIPATTAAMHADPTAGAGGTVPGMIAGAAQPPDPATPFARNYTAGFTPFNQVLAGSYANDPSMANFGTGVDLGRTAALGPGSSYSTQNEVAKANMAPHDIPLGMTRVTPRPDLGAAPAGVEPKIEYGGSPVEQAVQGETAKEAQADVVNGSQASDALAKLDALQALRNTVVQGRIAPGDALWDEAAKKADVVFGTGAFTRLAGDRLEILRSINAQMKSITAATRLAFSGDPSMRQLVTVLDAGLPDAESNQFDNTVGALRQTLNTSVDDALAANKFVPHAGDPVLAQEYRAGKLARHMAAARAAEEALKASAAAPASTPPAPPPGKKWIWNSSTGQVELQ